MCKVTIIDSMCGTGKTSYAINKMTNTNTNDMNFMYITPYLDEVSRIKSNVTNRRFYEPTNKNSKGSKLQGFKDLIIKDKDIASTHALFTSVDDETYDLIRNSNYTLILDEVMNVIDTIKVSKSDFDIMIERKLIEIQEDNKIIWIDEEYTGNFDKYKILAQNDNLYLHTRNKSEDKVILLVWTFPANIFKAFKEIYILTYLFKGQLQRAYYDMYDIKYTYKSVRYIDNEFKLVDYIDYNHEEKDNLKELINIYDGKLNTIGDKDYSLSSSWLRDIKNKNQLNKLKNNTYNYFKNILKSKAKYNMWTTILGKDDKKSEKVRIALSGDGYARGFVPCNCRATNIYSEKNCIAYLLNRFLNPLDKGFFEDKGIVINEELWALSELIQFVWRSAIRNNKEIYLYIPSERMRNLLINYINNKLTF